MKNSKHISILAQGYFSSKQLWVFLATNNIQSLIGIDNGFNTCEVSSSDEARVVELVANKLGDRIQCIMSHNSHKEAVQARKEYWLDIEVARKQAMNHTTDAIEYMYHVSHKSSIKISLTKPTLSKETIERMDGLHETWLEDTLLGCSKTIIQQLSEEGFERDEIVSYLKHLIDKNI